MRSLKSLTYSLLLLALLSGAACAQELQNPPISDERPLLLSELAAELQRQAAGTPQLQAVAAQVAGAIQSIPSQGAAAPIVLSGAQRQQLAGMVQAAIQGDPNALAALNRFPGVDMPTVGKALQAELAQLPPAQDSAAPRPARVVEQLGIPVANQTPPTTTLKHLGMGIFRGDVYDAEKAKLYPDSKRLAEVLNRLSLNGTGWVGYKGRYVRSPRGLLELLAADGHSVEAYDHRSIANFSGLYYKAPGSAELRSVAAPVWLDTRVEVPGKDRTMLVPATHSELIFSIRGPVVNADVAFFLAIDHKTSFRPTAWKRPSWTGSKKLRRFEGREALRAVSAAAWVRRSLSEASAENNLAALQSGPYGQLGVCNDATALVEARMGIEATHWPLVRQRSVMASDADLLAVSDRIPYDTDAATQPELERVIHSIPFEPGQVPDLYPTLAEDLGLVAAQLKREQATARAERNQQELPSALQLGLDDRIRGN